MLQRVDFGMDHLQGAGVSTVRIVNGLGDRGGIGVFVGKVGNLFVIFLAMTVSRPIERWL